MRNCHYTIGFSSMINTQLKTLLFIKIQDFKENLKNLLNQTNSPNSRIFAATYFVFWSKRINFAVAYYKKTNLT